MQQASNNLPIDSVDRMNGGDNHAWVAEYGRESACQEIAHGHHVWSEEEQYEPPNGAEIDVKDHDREMQRLLTNEKVRATPQMERVCLHRPSYVHRRFHCD